MAVKSKVKILQNLAAFSEYMNFTKVGFSSIRVESKVIIHKLHGEVSLVEQDPIENVSPP